MSTQIYTGDIFTRTVSTDVSMGAGGNLEKTKRTISIVAGFSRNTKQTTNEKLNLIPVDVQKADKCAKIAKTDEGKGFNLRKLPVF